MKISLLKIALCVVVPILASSYQLNDMDMVEEKLSKKINDGTLDEEEVNQKDAKLWPIHEKGLNFIDGDIMATEKEIKEVYGKNKEIKKKKNDEKEEEDERFFENIDKFLEDGDIGNFDASERYNDLEEQDGRTGSTYRWMNHRVAYTISSSLGIKAKKAIANAMKAISEATCIAFRIKTSSDTDYISFERHSGCYSQVGRQGGRQVISIGPGCEYDKIATHEIVHALGFWHEQSRSDRNHYVKINYNNILPGKSSNFDRQTSTVSFGSKYDYRSIMHYKGTAFGKSGFFNFPKRTISVKGGWGILQKLGQPTHGGKMTSSDIHQIKKMYNCGSTTALRRRRRRRQVFSRRRRWLGKK